MKTTYIIYMNVLCRFHRNHKEVYHLILPMSHEICLTFFFSPIYYNICRIFIFDYDLHFNFHLYI